MNSKRTNPALPQVVSELEGRLEETTLERQGKEDVSRKEEPQIIPEVDHKGGQRRGQLQHKNANDWRADQGNRQMV